MVRDYQLRDFGLVLGDGLVEALWASVQRHGSAVLGVTAPVAPQLLRLDRNVDVLIFSQPTYLAQSFRPHERTFSVTRSHCGATGSAVQ